MQAQYKYACPDCFQTCDTIEDALAHAKQDAIEESDTDDYNILEYSASDVEGGYCCANCWSNHGDSQQDAEACCTEAEEFVEIEEDETGDTIVVSDIQPTEQPPEIII